MSSPNTRGSIPDSSPMETRQTSGSVPDSQPTPARTPASVPDSEPTLPVRSNSVPDSTPTAPPPGTKSAPVVKRQDTRLAPEVLAPPPRNARPYNGQKLGVKHDKGVDNIPANLLTLALVDLDVVDGVLTPGARTRVLDRAPWTGWPIVELN